MRRPSITSARRIAGTAVALAAVMAMASPAGAAPATTAATNVTIARDPLVGLVAFMPITFTAKISSPGKAGNAIPAETVVFSDGKTVIGSAKSVNGVANFTTSSLVHGVHQIWAKYPGASGFAASISGDLGTSIGLAHTTTKIVASATSAHVGVPITFTATVSAVAPSIGTPAMTVVFRIGTSMFAKVTTTDGVARATTTIESVETYVVSATPLTNDNFYLSRGTVTVTITPHGTPD
jgi:hypothetical protein